MLGMTSDAPTKAGKHVTSDIASAITSDKQDAVFWLAHMTLYVIK